VGGLSDLGSRPAGEVRPRRGGPARAERFASCQFSRTLPRPGAGMTNALQRLPEQLLGRVPSRVVHSRRVQGLAHHFSRLVPPGWVAALTPAGAHCLDVGSGDGRLARTIMDKRPNVRIEGLDVLARSDALIPVTIFDGKSIPAGDASYDVVMVCDVLHHCDD